MMCGESKILNLVFFVSVSVYDRWKCWIYVCSRRLRRRLCFRQISMYRGRRSTPCTPPRNSSNKNSTICWSSNSAWRSKIKNYAGELGFMMDDIYILQWYCSVLLSLALWCESPYSHRIRMNNKTWIIVIVITLFLRVSCFSKLTKRYMHACNAMQMQKALFVHSGREKKLTNSWKSWRTSWSQSSTSQYVWPGFNIFFQWMCGGMYLDWFVNALIFVVNVKKKILDFRNCIRLRFESWRRTVMKRLNSTKMLSRE